MGSFAVPTSELDKYVVESRKKFALALDDEVLDYKHNNPLNVEKCVVTLIRIFGNITDNPSEPKYRQVKTTSNIFKNDVASMKGGEHLMMLAGFKPEVVDMIKYWVFDADEHSTKFRVLVEAKNVLEKAMHHIHEKAERKRKEDEQKKLKVKLEREKILLHIEDDKLDRKMRIETQVIPGLLATALPAVPAADQEGAGSSAQENSAAPSAHVQHWTGMAPAPGSRLESTGPSADAEDGMLQDAETEPEGELLQENKSSLAQQHIAST